MTEEQIKNLKEGDKFTIEFTVKVNEVGNFLIAEAGGKAYVPEYGCVGLRAAKLITPPTFEVGDTVRIIRDPLTGTVHGHGRDKAFIIGATVKVAKSLNGGDIGVMMPEEGLTYVNIHCLELVKKAVKDKYSVAENAIAFYVKDNEYIVVDYYKDVHPNAKEAAEAECARLNAEWRKQQEGGAE